MLLIRKVKRSFSEEEHLRVKEDAAKLMQYNHPNIVKVVETFDLPGDHIKLHAIIMEYCNGNYHFIYVFSW